LADAAGTLKGEARRFWGTVYERAYAEGDAALTPEALRAGLEQLEDMFRYQSHGAVVEMPLADLAGKRVLEIGSGAGGHSALFAKHGARVTAIDLAWERARATAQKFALLGKDADGCCAFQGDAEALAFADASFDIVYSNGVLHHTPDTERAIAEVWRVLKPGGLAVVMLYCKSSFHFWFTLVFCVGILKGRLFRDRDWLGHATEWIGRSPQTERNPVTRCYSRGGIAKLFARFAEVRPRKMGFFFYAIPKIGRLYRRWQIRHLGVHPGGILVYGEPWPFQSCLELLLGRYIGFAWFVAARKPEASA
jgi:ubiquinone/menaquinone biosynthesis C-methylase UbiE